MLTAYRSVYISSNNKVRILLA